MPGTAPVGVYSLKLVDERDDTSGTLLNAPPQRVVEEVLQQTRPVSFIALSTVGFSVTRTAGWVREFGDAFARTARDRRLDRPAPSVVVFADGLNFADRSTLHDAGAVVLDRAAGAVSDSDALRAWLNSHLPAKATTPAPVQSPLAEADRAAANQYPPDVTPDILLAAVAVSNRHPG